MLFGSAQRDPRRFDHPDRFDVARGDPAHHPTFVIRGLTGLGLTIPARG